MLTHTRTTQYQTAEGRLVSASDSVSAEGEVAFDGTIAVSGTPNVEVDIAFAVTGELKSLLLYSVQGMTIKTNSSSAPDDTIVLVAGVPLVWNTNDVAANPLTTDVTKLFFTNASATLTSAVKVRALVDVTP